MQNLEQKRAAHALAWSSQIGSGKDGGEVVKKIPPLIMNNGMLASMAFASEMKGKNDKQKLANEGHHSVFAACIDHLAKNCDLDIPPAKTQTVRIFLNWVSSEQDSGFLRAITAETLAYLAYLRRFVTREKNNG